MKSFESNRLQSLTFQGPYNRINFTVPGVNAPPKISIDLRTDALCRAGQGTRLGGRDSAVEINDKFNPPAAGLFIN